ncbi:MAG: hypothetical protein AB8G18_15470 [Gammaproteobacteria bacterium]
MTLLIRTIAVSAAALCTFTTSADEIQQFTCTECRSTEFARDFGNHAFNLVYGPESEVFASEMIITNLDGGWVHVDLSFVLVDNIISNLGDMIGLDLGIPNGDLMIETTTDNTETDEYSIDMGMVDTMGVLPVGEPDTDDPNGDNNGGGDSSGGGDTGGGVGAGTGSGSGGVGGPGSGGSGGSSGGWACTSAGEGWTCVSY